MQENQPYALWQYKQKREMEEFALNRGYIPFEPLLFDDYEQQATDKTMTKEQLVTVISSKQKFQLLRPDITTMLMKQILPYVDNERVLKLFYQAPIFRSQEDGIKEINQFGIELLGKVNKEAEGEIIDLAVAYLTGVPFLLEVGNTKFFKGLLDKCQLTKQQERTFKKLLYIKNREELISFGKKNQLPTDVQNIIAVIFSLRGTLAEVKEKVGGLPLNERMTEAVTELSNFTKWEKNIVFDLSMVSQLPYYEGTIFKGYYQKQPKEVLSGGRYDSLSQKYGNRVGAIGFSIDTDVFLGVRRNG